MTTLTKKIATTCLSAIFAMAVYAQSSTITHTVAKGETITSIAQKYGVTTEDIIKLNPMAKILFTPGMELKIPAKKETKVDNNPKPSIEKPQVAKGTTVTPTPTPTPSKPSAHGKRTSKTRKSKSLASEIKGVDYPLLQFGSHTRSNTMYLALQGNCGFSNFKCSEVSSNGTLAYGGEVQWQFYKTQGTLDGYFAQAGIGYQSLGAAGHSMGYMQARILPLGYTISLNDDINVVVKAGGYVGMPLSDLETKNNSYSASFDYGIDCGVCIDYKMFSVGATFQYGFFEVAPDSRATLIISLPWYRL